MELPALYTIYIGEGKLRSINQELQRCNLSQHLPQQTNLVGSVLAKQINRDKESR